ncbi:MAG: polymer-forming cytoskeletal protein [Alphaproteobacteria bacterium]|nr:polymer-forming cytoskeletal protein [Alphaproteobacteria bacterium]
MPPAAPPASAAPASFRPAAPAAAAMAAAPARPAGATLPAERRMLVVGRGITLQGTITDCERLVVEGTVEATLNNALEVSIAATGVFKGEVEIDDADISGAFDGTMTCRNTLMVRSSGRISGAVRCRRLSVEEGGQISGRIEMLPAEPPRAAASGPASGTGAD